MKQTPPLTEEQKKETYKAYIALRSKYLDDQEEINTVGLASIMLGYGIAKGWIDVDPATVTEEEYAKFESSLQQHIQLIEEKAAIRRAIEEKAAIRRAIEEIFAMASAPLTNPKFDTTVN